MKQTVRKLIYSDLKELENSLLNDAKISPDQLKGMDQESFDKMKKEFKDKDDEVRDR
jgi:hypothetical protein